MITTFPAETPVTIPVEEPTVATDGDEPDHVPPDVALVKVTVVPAQTDEAPLIAPTAVEVDTVTVRVAKQPPDVT